jgi:hypothetical protein
MSRIHVLSIKDRSFSASTTALLFIALILTRTLLPILIGTLPPMENLYISLGQKLFETNDLVTIRVSPFYATILYFSNIFGSWQITSWLIYTISSIGLGWIVYLMAKEMFDQRTAQFSLAILILHPSLTFAVVGFSHTVVISTSLLYLSLYSYWKILHRKQETLMCLIGSLSATLATLIRPELLLYFVLFSCAYIAINIYSIVKRKQYRTFLLNIGMIVIFSTLIIFQYGLIKQRTDSIYMNLFTDARYSYETYTHTLSLRSVGTIDEAVARELAFKAFGDPVANQYSIFKAMQANPKEAIKNVIFNIKDLLSTAGHPLFMPFFLYLLVGIALVHQSPQKSWRQHLFLGLIFLPCLIAVIVMHVEVRYLNPVVLPLIIWMALGMVHLQERGKKYTQYAFFSLMIVLFIVNTVYYSINPIAN